MRASTEKSACSHFAVAEHLGVTLWPLLYSTHDVGFWRKRTDKWSRSDVAETTLAKAVPAQNEARCPRLSAVARKDLSRFAWLSFRHRRSGNSGSGLPCGLQSCGYLRDARTLVLRDHKFVRGRRGAVLPGVDDDPYGVPWP